MMCACKNVAVKAHVYLDSECYSFARGIGGRRNYIVRTCLPQISSFTHLVAIETIRSLLLSLCYPCTCPILCRKVLIQTTCLFILCSLLSPDMFSEINCLLLKCLIRPLMFYSLLIISLVGSTNAHSGMSFVDSLLITPVVGSH